MSDDVKSVVLRLDRELFLLVAQHALNENKTRTAVIRECIEARFPIASPDANAQASQQANEETNGKGKTTSKGKTRTTRKKRTSKVGKRNP